jgi:hypothetical protein
MMKPSIAISVPRGWRSIHIRGNPEGFVMALMTVSGGVPVGTYTGSFAGTEAQPANKELGYGPGLRWKFHIASGTQAGQSTGRVTGPTPSPRNACGKLLSGLIGRALKEGEQINPDDYIGRMYMIIVAAGPGGGTRVEAISPMPT